MKYPHPTLEIWVEEQEEEEELMNTDYRDTEVFTQRRHILNRLRDVTWEKERDAEKIFGLADQDAPTTGTEMVKRIKDGQYVLTKRSLTDSYDYIRWRDPNTKEDKAGYDAFLNKLYQAKQAATDDITVYPPEKGLETLRAFEAIAIQ